MTPDPAGVVGAAAVRAMMDARWETSDLLSRKARSAVPDLLRARAAELAGSPAGRDQVMAVALETAADDVEGGRATLGAGALFFFQPPRDPAERLDTQRRVFRRIGRAAPDPDAVTAAREAAWRRENGGGIEISARLMDDARLHKQLWDDPRIPADPDTRLAMLCSVPRLVDRARALDPLHFRSLRPLMKWPRRPLDAA